MKKWNRVSYAMINAIINNNESIPSIMCEDIERTISMRDWRPFSRFAKHQRQEQFLKIYHGQLFAEFLMQNADLH